MFGLGSGGDVVRCQGDGGVVVAEQRGWTLLLEANLGDNAAEPHELLADEIRGGELSFSDGQGNELLVGRQPNDGTVCETGEGTIAAAACVRTDVKGANQRAHVLRLRHEV